MTSKFSTLKLAVRLTCVVMLRSNSPLKRGTDDWDPCSRVTVLSALKESRKRSFVVDDEEDELMRPTKRCLHFYHDFVFVLFCFLVKQHKNLKVHVNRHCYNQTFSRSANFTSTLECLGACVLYNTLRVVGFFYVNEKPTACRVHVAVQQVEHKNVKSYL